MILELFKESCLYVLENTLSLVPQESLSCDDFSHSATSSILLSNQIRVYLTSNLEFLKLFSEIMLGDNNPSQETLEDISKEFINLVAGRAKMIAESRDESFNISTPEFLGYNKPDSYDMEFHLQLAQAAKISLFTKGSYGKK